MPRLANVDGETRRWAYGDSIEANITAQGSLRARFGYAWGRTLVFATGGLAVASVDTDYTDGAARDSYSHVAGGLDAWWRHRTGFRTGVERKAPDYRYTDFGQLSDWTETTDSGYNMKNDLTEQAVHLGVSYRFGTAQSWFK